MFFRIFLTSHCFLLLLSSLLLPAFAQSSSALLSQGTALLRLNQNDDAARCFQNFCASTPNSAEGHRLWAVALSKLGRVSEAIDQLNQAIRANPNAAPAWLNLAALQQSQGSIVEAIDTYKEFLKRFPTDDDAPRVRNLVALLQKNNSPLLFQTTIMPTPPVTAKISNVDEQDYLNDLIGKGAIHWLSGQMPLKVFIDNGEAIAGYRSAFFTILKEAFRHWMHASNHLIRFTFTNQANDADIVCTWTADAAKFEKRMEAAETRLYNNERGLAKGEMEFLTTEVIGSKHLVDEKMRCLALHEIGHVLGLTGHTNNRGDIMYAYFAQLPPDRDLSKRDINTIRRLYTDK